MKFLCIVIFIGIFLIVIINIPFSDKYITAIFGLIGVITGSMISIIGNIVLHMYKEKPNKELQEQQINMLNTMLNKDPNKWRKLSTLSSVIGATENETRRLLIKINARASEKTKDDEVWGLLKYNPLPVD